MDPVILVQLSENDKRIIIAICLVVILVFVIIGLLGSLIIRTMKWQAKKCDTLVSDVVVNRIISEPKHLRRYARKKNGRYFLKQAWIPILLMTIGAIVLVIHNSVFNNWLYNPFNQTDGFSSLLFLWDFSDADSYTVVFGMKVLAKWPPLMNEPHFVVDAIYSYIAVPLLIVGAIWYIVAAQAYLARTIRAWKLSKQVFEKSLEGFNQNSPIPPSAINTDNNQEQQKTTL